MNIREYLKEHKLLTDGAFGTYYAQLSDIHDTVSEKANISNPKLVKRIHREYINAGAKLIKTNTFAANSSIIGEDKKEQKRIILEGFKLAKEAVEESGKEVFIAADIGPISADIYDGHAEILEEYGFIVDTFLEAGADIFLFETFSDNKYLDILAKHIKNRTDAFIINQFCLNRYGYTKNGVSAKRLLEDADKMDELDAVGFNCGIGSAHMYQIMKKLNYSGNKYITAMPNSGYPQITLDRTVYLDNAAYFANRMQDIAELPISIMGGCCGTTPTYIEEVRKTVDFRKKAHIQHKDIERDYIIQRKTDTNEFYNKLSQGKKVIAVELDPPYDAKAERIMECANILKALHVDMITFADSPMGRGRVDSISMGIKVLNEVGVPVMPHIACRDKNMIGMRAGILGGYVNNIRNLLVVTGDPIPSVDRVDVTGVFDFNSIRLMEFLKEMNEEHFSEAPIYYGGALNHNRTNLDMEIERMKKKLLAGCSYFLTQPIFSQEEVEKIGYIKKKTNAKILCGIMPLVSYKNAAFIQNEIAGMQVPDDVVNSFTPEMSREEGERIGILMARDLLKLLEPVADGYYFMLPFNRVHLVDAILNN